MLGVEGNSEGRLESSARGSARWGASAGVALAALAVHAHSIAFGFVDLDDRDFLVDDHEFLARPFDLFRTFARSYMHVVDPAHPYRRPLVTASYVLDARWSGARPFGYHVTNVVLHAIASTLCLGLLRRLGFEPLVAVLGALFFAVNPALVSDVAWIPGRNDSLLAVLALGAWLAFMADAARPTWRAKSLHWTLFALALFTKETAVVLPLVCLAQAMLLRGGVSPPPQDRRWSWVALLPGWTVCVALRFAAGPLAGGGVIAPPEIGHRLWLLLSGLGQLAFPFDPSLVGVVSDSPIAGGLLAATAAAMTTAFLHGVRPTVVFFGAVTFVLWSLPPLAAGGTLVLGSRLYVPAVGVVIAGAELVRASGLDKRVLAAFGAATIAVLAVVTTGFEATFHDPRSFARAAVDAAPHSPVAHLCLGYVDQRAGDDDGALREYARAIALGSAYVVHNNIAIIHMAHGRWADAERELREELAVDPGYALAYRNLAIVLRHVGRPDDAAAADIRARELSREFEAGRPR